MASVLKIDTVQHTNGTTAFTIGTDGSITFNNTETGGTLDLLFSGMAAGNFTLSQSANNYDALFVAYDLSTGTQTVASSSSTDDDWERTLWLSPYNISTGYSYIEGVDRDKFAVIGTQFYYYRTSTNNVVRRVWGVRF